MVTAFDEIPRDADRVIFFPRAAGGAEPDAEARHDAARPRRHRDRHRGAAVGGPGLRAGGAPSSAAARAGGAIVPIDGYDPGRERRAEQRARELLRSCVNDEEWAMYRDLGFIRVWGALARRRRSSGADARTAAARRTPT